MEVLGCAIQKGLCFIGANMKIANKITKRQYTALNKHNEKMLADEIECATLDYTSIAHNLASNIECVPGLDDKLNDGNYKETTSIYRKELNASYRIFITNRNKIYKAYQKGLT